MVITIGGTSLPGPQTTVRSGQTRAVDTESPGTVALVGEADLQEGNAEANRAYGISNSTQARRRFGQNSKLAEQVEDALGEGGLPVYGLAPEAFQETDVDVSSGSFPNAPVTEDASRVAFSDGSGNNYNARITLGDVANAPEEDGVIFYNPVRGTVQDKSNVTGLTADYVYHNYDRAFESLASQEGDIIDFVVPLTEEESVVQDAHDTVRAMEQRYNLAMVFAGAPNQLDPTNTAAGEDTSVQENSNFDSSRMQQLYPSREADGTTIMGAYGGRRAAIGINTSAMGKRLHTQKDLIATLSHGEKVNLDNHQIVPVADESRGARIVTDSTMVADDNDGEAAMRDSLSRLVIDYVIDIENANSEQFIGDLNTKSTRDSLQDVISSELGDLIESNVLESYTVFVYEKDAVTAGLEIGIDTVDPLRNIAAVVTAGEVQDVADQASSIESGGF